MSLERKEIITCPQCNNKSEFVFWDSINVDLDPDMRAKVMNGEVFRWTCPHCGANVYVPFETLYHDMKHKFMIMFSPHEPNQEDKYDITDIPNPIGGTSDEYSFRMVYDPNRLKEKILIFEQELNDVAIEKLKYIMINYVDSSIALDDEELFFAGVTEVNEKDKYGRMVFRRLSQKEERNGFFSFPMEKYYEQCLTLKLDNRFEAKGWTCVDEGWISRKIKEL